LADVKDISRKKLPDLANTSPKKIESARTWDAPSTSSKIEEKSIDVKEDVKSVPFSEETLKRRKGVDCNDGSSNKIRSEKKRTKVKHEIKGEIKDFSSARFKKEGKLEKCFVSGTEKSFESSFDTSVSNSDIEDIVSND